MSGIDRALDAAMAQMATTLLAPEAQTVLKARTNSATKVTVPLSSDAIEFVKDTSTIQNFIFTSDGTGKPHSLMCAAREVIRVNHSQAPWKDYQHEKVLVVGATTREMGLYKHRANFHYYIHASETKDHVRVESKLKDFIVKSLHKSRNRPPVGHNFDLKPGVGLEDYLAVWSAHASKGVVASTKLQKANVLLMEDVGYTMCEHDWINLFAETGADIAYGYMAMPLEMTFEDMPTNPYYTYKVESNYVGGVIKCSPTCDHQASLFSCENGPSVTVGGTYTPMQRYSAKHRITDESLLLFHQGESDAYRHLTKNWSLMARKSIITFKDAPFSLHVELHERCGPMVRFTVARFSGSAVIDRVINLPPRLRYIRVLDIAKLDHNTGKLQKPRPEHYFSVLAAEFEETVNYMCAVAEAQRTLVNTFVFVKKRKNGISLTDRELARKWWLKDSDADKFALAAFVYVIARTVHCNELAVKAIEQQFHGTIFSWMLKFKWVSKLFKGDSTRVADWVIEHADWFHHQVMTGKSDVCREEVFQVVDVADEVVVACDCCTEVNMNLVPVPGLVSQEVLCVNAQAVLFKVAKDKDQIERWRTALQTAHGEAPAGGLQDAINLAIENMPRIPFEVSVPFLLFEGPPGCGKSHIIRALADPLRDIIVVAMARLRGDYKCARVLKRAADGTVVNVDVSYRARTFHHAYKESGVCETLWFDEFPAIDYEIIADLVKIFMPKRVVLVGDTMQTRLKDLSEGVYVGDVLDMTQVTNHYMRVCYRFPGFFCALLNRVYYTPAGKTMRSAKYESGVRDIGLYVVDMNKTATPDAVNGIKLAFTKDDARHYCGDENATVRAAQGSSAKNVYLYVTKAAAFLLRMPSMSIVALSRHTDTLTVYHDGSVEVVAWMTAHYLLDEDFAVNYYKYLGTVDNKPASAISVDDVAADKLLVGKQAPEIPAFVRVMDRLDASHYVYNNYGVTMVPQYYSAFRDVGEIGQLSQMCSVSFRRYMMKSPLWVDVLARLKVFDPALEGWSDLNLEAPSWSRKPEEVDVVLDPPQPSLIPVTDECNVSVVSARYTGPNSDIKNAFDERVAYVKADVYGATRLTPYDVALRAPVERAEFSRPVRYEVLRTDPLSDSTLDSGEHIGQLKLLTVESKFVRQCRAKHVVYLGASPGDHIVTLMKAYPDVQFILVDIRPAGDLLRKVVNTVTEPTLGPSQYIQQYADARLMDKILALTDDVGVRPAWAIISDIRRETKTGDKFIMEDMALQSSLVVRLQPVSALLKFRMPYFNDGQAGVSRVGQVNDDFDNKVFRFIATPSMAIWRQPYAKKNSAEFRLYLEGNNYLERILSLNDMLLLQAQARHWNDIRGKLVNNAGVVYSAEELMSFDALQTEVEQKYLRAMVPVRRLTVAQLRGMCVLPIWDALGVNCFEYAMQANGIKVNRMEIITDLREQGRYNSANLVVSGTYDTHAITAVAVKARLDIRVIVPTEPVSYIPHCANFEDCVYVVYDGVDHYYACDQGFIIPRMAAEMQNVVLARSELRGSRVLDELLTGELVQNVPRYGGVVHSNVVKYDVAIIEHWNDTHSHQLYSLDAIPAQDRDRVAWENSTTVFVSNDQRVLGRVVEGNDYGKVLRAAIASIRPIGELNLTAVESAKFVANRNLERMAVRDIDPLMELTRWTDVSAETTLVDEKINDPIPHFVTQAAPVNDAYLLSKLLVMSVSAETLVALNETQAYDVPSGFRDLAYETDELIMPTNVAHNIIADEKDYYAVCASDGLNFSGISPMHAMKTARKRYNRDKVLIPTTGGTRELIDKMITKYFLFCKTFSLSFVEYVDNYGDDIAAEFFCDASTKKYFERYKGEGGFDFPDNAAKISFFMKNSFKPFVSTKGVNLDKAAQGIAAWSPALLMMFCLSFRLISRYDSFTDRKDELVYVATDNGIPFVHFAKSIAERMRHISRYPVQRVIGDAVEYDGNQDSNTQYLEYAYNARLGVGRAFLNIYYYFRSYRKMRGPGFVLSIICEKTSGEPATLYTNGIPMKVTVFYVVEWKGEFMLIYKGDDVLFVGACIEIIEECLNAWNDCTELRITIKLVDVGEFCGMVMAEGIMAPNAHRTLCKILAYRAPASVGYKAFAQYQQSIRDVVQLWKDIGWNNVLRSTAMLKGCSYEEADLILDAVVSWSHVSELQWFGAVTLMKEKRLQPVGCGGIML